MADDKTGLPDGWVIVDTPAIAVSHDQEKPNTANGLALAATAGTVPLATRAAVEAATNPNVPRIMSNVGQVVGGLEGLRRGGPLEAAGGVWAGGKAGWFTGKLAQRMAAPVANLATKAAPYAQALSTLSGAAGVGDLAQMAEPNRQDIGFLGVSNAGAPIDPAHVPAANEAIAKLAERMGRPDIAAQWRGQISKGR